MKILRWLLVLPGAWLAALLVNLFIMIALVFAEYITLHFYGVVSWNSYFDFLLGGLIANGAAGFASIVGCYLGSCQISENEWA